MCPTKKNSETKRIICSCFDKETVQTWEIMKLFKWLINAILSQTLKYSCKSPDTSNEENVESFFGILFTMNGFSAKLVPVHMIS